MSSWRVWGIYAALLAFAAATGVATRATSTADSSLPSVENAGPAGLKALFLYLAEGGHPVRAHRARLTELPSDTAALVLAAPTGRVVEREEAEATAKFVEAGGTLVYLAPRSPSRPQPWLEDWLQLSLAGLLLPDRQGGADDVSGATVKVDAAVGLARGTKELRVGAGQLMDVGHANALPVAQRALWRIGLGKGEVWVASGPDLAENRRLELADNLRLWENLAARGPVLFDEFHHVAAPGPPLSPALLAFALQFLACAAVFAWAKGARLGPARPPLVRRHRTSLEYIVSFAHLTRQARVERELLAEQLAQLRVLLQERLGIAVSLSDRDAALELERHCQLPAPNIESLFGRARAAAPGLSAHAYSALSRELARLERVVTGRTRESSRAP
ncbi:MAG: DUF4350 domain-containing protein [Myxococcota bacterium]